MQAGIQLTCLGGFVPFLLSVHGEFIRRLQTPDIENVLEPCRFVHGIWWFLIGEVFHDGELKDVEPDFVW